VVLTRQARHETVAAMSTYPVVYHQAPPVERNRLTVFFRWIIVIPRPGLTEATRFPMAYITRATAYSLLMTDKWPPFED
jgi:hypothetical protein